MPFGSVSLLLATLLAVLCMSGIDYDVGVAALRVAAHGRTRSRVGAAGALAAHDGALEAQIQREMAVTGAAGALDTSSALAMELHANAHAFAHANTSASAADAAADSDGENAVAAVEVGAHATTAASASASVSAAARFELLYPCYVCTRALNSFVVQYQALVERAARMGEPLRSGQLPQWNRTGICPQVIQTLVRPKDYGPCLRYENGVCLKRFGRPGIIAPDARPKRDGEGALNNPFTRVFGERPAPNVTVARLPTGRGNSTAAVPLGNDSWCGDIVDDLIADAATLSKLFTTGCTVFPGRSLDQHWADGAGDRAATPDELQQQYFPKVDVEAGCRMRDACACLWQKGKPFVPYCPAVDSGVFDTLEYWSEPADLFDRRVKALAQRRHCLRIGPLNPPLPAPKRPAPLPPGADAPKLVRDPKTGAESLMPTVVKPAVPPGYGQAAARKAAYKASDEYKRKRKAKEDAAAKKQADMAKQHQAERKKGPKKGGITKHAPNF